MKPVCGNFVNWQPFTTLDNLYTTMIGSPQKEPIFMTTTKGTTIREFISRYSDEEIEARFKDGYTITYWSGLGFIWKAPYLYTAEDFCRRFGVPEIPPVVSLFRRNEIW